MKTLSNLVAAAALFAASSAVFAADKAPPQLPLPADAPTVVLVHGAFVDESSWNKLIPELNKRGIKAIAVANPLTSLRDDVDATRRVINAQTGPVVLVGHSWGGTVITEAGANTKVKALVYVAGYAPSAGESSRDDLQALPASPGFESTEAVTGADGYVTLARQTILADFAQDVPPQEAVRIAASQRPLRAANYDEDVGMAAWKSKPSWYIVAETDRMFDPDAQRALANKIQARTVSLLSGHVPMLSRPDDVADVIEDAVRSVGVPSVATLSQR